MGTKPDRIWRIKQIINNRLLLTTRSCLTITKPISLQYFQNTKQLGTNKRNLQQGKTCSIPFTFQHK